MRSVGHLVSAGLLDLAAVDSCKPGIVLWGEEGSLRWCDRNPRWDKIYGRDPLRLELLTLNVAQDLLWLSTRYKLIAIYVNVKAYKLALQNASRAIGVDIVDLGPPRLSPIHYNKHAKYVGSELEKLLRI